MMKRQKSVPGYALSRLDCGGVILSRDWFEAEFFGLINRSPFKWQVDAFERLVAGDAFDVSVPTGLGKSALIPIWLCALAWQAKTGSEITVGRRLVYVVNRRTVVDQSTMLAEQVVEGIREKPDSELAVALRRLSYSGSELGLQPVAISTLRGEMADNGAWRLDPSRPAIVVGTVDMVGSRLLFCGYGDGRSRRPFHAGLIGHDAFVIHDEAHLTPAFGAVLERVRFFSGPDFRYTEMTATPKPGGGRHCIEFNPDQESDVALERWNAAKRLVIDRALDAVDTGGAAGSKQHDERISQLALARDGKSRAVIVFVATPGSATRIAKNIRRKLRPGSGRKGSGTATEERVGTIMGPMRGFERDALTQSDVFAAFKETPRGKIVTRYLVCTSAAEVGVDLDADWCVSDLSTFDAMIQRLGRLNRAGLLKSATMKLVLSKDQCLWNACGAEAAKAEQEKALSASGGVRKKLLESALQTTLTLLCVGDVDSQGDLLGVATLAPGPIDVSPRALHELMRAEAAAFAKAPQPMIPTIERHHLDAWSMTSVMPALGPPVGDFLHGVTDDTDGDTDVYLVWRDIPEVVLDRAALADPWLQAVPVIAMEKARFNNAGSAVEWLDKRLESKDWDGRVLRLIKQQRDGEVVPITLKPAESKDKSDATLRKKKLADALRGARLLIVPPEIGGLSRDGVADGSAAYDDGRDYDLTRHRFGEHAASTWRADFDAQAAAWRVEGVEAPIAGSDAVLRRRLKGVSRHHQVIWSHIEPDGNGEDPDWAIVVTGNRGAPVPDDDGLSAFSRTPMSLERHGKLTRDHLCGIVSACGMDVGHRGTAGQEHDSGKAASIWQRAAGAFGAETMAKTSGERARWKILRGYRHELGNVFQMAAADPSVVGLLKQDDWHDADLDRLLMVHSIAMHHGWSRPMFRDNAPTGSGADPDIEEAVMAALPRVFVHLQRAFGYWGLAWREGQLKAADALASQELKP